MRITVGTGTDTVTIEHSVDRWTRTSSTLISASGSYGGARLDPVEVIELAAAMNALAEAHRLETRRG